MIHTGPPSAACAATSSWRRQSTLADPTLHCSSAALSSPASQPSHTLPSACVRSYSPRPCATSCQSRHPPPHRSEEKQSRHWSLFA